MNQRRSGGACRCRGTAGCGTHAPAWARGSGESLGSKCETGTLLASARAAGVIVEAVVAIDAHSCFAQQSSAADWS